MHPVLKQAFEIEMDKAKTLYKESKYTECFSHLERAHILGQRFVYPHTVNHWWMLKVGIRKKDNREILGQLVRLAVAGIGSLLGRVPIGNTGGSNIGIMKVLPIEGDLKVLFDRAGEVK
ncbi:DUF3703 domain-containing protein [Leptospira brenneri]|uniref:DUF3703 domain-containing protein n=1 Tax=Leptospira brenneri TaxID=2023182 RepID=A0A2M9Y478_9LEPT|nr:DUF3703 domain-containing protein [Leptospira brenneri]PJZ46390.1 hypothetical protein CH361_04660 [Leptospira brenneri]TGK96492.1 DUF3703 domain-containing protein [Leptospira brenneri]